MSEEKLPITTSDEYGVYTNFKKSNMSKELLTLKDFETWRLFFNLTENDLKDKKGETENKNG